MFSSEDVRAACSVIANRGNRKRKKSHVQDVINGIKF